MMKLDFKKDKSPLLKFCIISYLNRSWIPIPSSISTMAGKGKGQLNGRNDKNCQFNKDLSLILGEEDGGPMRNLGQNYRDSFPYWSSVKSVCSSSWLPFFWSTSKQAQCCFLIKIQCLLLVELHCFCCCWQWILMLQNVIRKQLALYLQPGMVNHTPWYQLLSQCLIWKLAHFF